MNVKANRRQQPLSNGKKESWDRPLVYWMICEEGEGEKVAEKDSWVACLNCVHDSGTMYTDKYAQGGCLFCLLCESLCGRLGRTNLWIGVRRYYTSLPLIPYGTLPLSDFSFLPLMKNYKSNYYSNITKLSHSPFTNCWFTSLAVHKRGFAAQFENL